MWRNRAENWISPPGAVPLLDLAGPGKLPDQSEAEFTHTRRLARPKLTVKIWRKLADEINRRLLARIPSIRGFQRFHNWR